MFGESIGGLGCYGDRIIGFFSSVIRGGNGVF